LLRIRLRLALQSALLPIGDDALPEREDLRCGNRFRKENGQMKSARAVAVEEQRIEALRHE
jgi:hypothetical protein